MPNINISYEEMRQRATQLRNAEPEVQAALQRIDSLMQGTLQSGNMAQLQDAYAEFRRGATVVLSSVREMSATLERSTEVMQSLDEGLNHRFR